MFGRKKRHPQRDLFLLVMGATMAGQLLLPLIKRILRLADSMFDT